MVIYQNRSQFVIVPVIVPVIVLVIVPVIVTVIVLVIVPVIKDKNRRVNQKGSYRPICLSNMFQDNRCCLIQQTGCVLANYTTSVQVPNMERSYVCLHLKNY